MAWECIYMYADARIAMTGKKKVDVRTEECR
jgi:hypothetical protein